MTAAEPDRKRPELATAGRIAPSEEVGRRASRYHGEIYAPLARRPDE